MSVPNVSTIMTSSHILTAGDVVVVNLDPIRGSEQSGIRPALVISNVLMHEVSKRIVVCPITRNMTPWPTKIPIPDGFKTQGMVLADQVRSLDYEERVLRQIETLPTEFVTLVRSYVGRLLDLDVAAASG
ncbi:MULTISPECIES: type II toxin-antitoxin system PemK/MazF family toxin [unclassified Rhizobium]|uniref:type II toxin-antitoxin system PemK/MazF family toxin n=1 Tax=unclassified Rhizobium TaxID=2613769 RepID=UPI001FD765CB|nr:MULTISPECIES: type II toxin-antitoxin system PemK/MazF family toxin [unclassified Rhizobium]